MDSPVNSTFKELIPVLIKHFPKMEEEVLLPNAFHEASITWTRKQRLHKKRKHRLLSETQQKAGIPSAAAQREGCAHPEGAVHTQASAHGEREILSAQFTQGQHLTKVHIHS